MRIGCRVTAAFLVAASMWSVITAQDSGSPDKSEAKPVSYEFTPTFEKGRVSTYRSSGTMTASMTVDGKVHESVVNNSDERTYTCSTAEDGGDAKIEVVINWLTQRVVDKEEVRLDIDTTKEPQEGEDVAIKGLRMLVGHKFTTTIGKSGTVNKVEGSKELLTRMGETLPGMSKQADPATLDADVKKSAELQYEFLRQEPAKVGDSWERATTAPLNDGPEGTLTYTFKEVAEKEGRKCLHLTVSGKLGEPKKRAFFKYEDVDWTGDVWLDAATREVVFSDFTLKCSVKNPTIKESMTQEVRTTLELVPAKKADDKENPDKREDNEKDK